MTLIRGDVIPTTAGLRDRQATAADGSSWRVRVRLLAERAATDAPVNGEPELAPTGATYVVSLARLDANDEVARDPQGRLLIGEPATLTVQADADVDLESALVDVIAGRVAHADRVAAQQAERRQVEGDWM